MKEQKIFLSWKLFCALHYRGFKIIYWFIAIYIDHRYYLFFYTFNQQQVRNLLSFVNNWWTTGGSWKELIITLVKN